MMLTCYLRVKMSWTLVPTRAIAPRIRNVIIIFDSLDRRPPDKNLTTMPGRTTTSASNSSARHHATIVNGGIDAFISG